MGLANTKFVERMPLDEKTTAQVGKIYELLVKPHPNYHNFRREAGWAYAQKRDSESCQTMSTHREVVVE